MEITGIDLFDLNVGMACAMLLRCLLISLALIYLIKCGYAMIEVGLRCSWILIYLIKMWVWHDCS